MVNLSKKIADIQFSWANSAPIDTIPAPADVAVPGDIVMSIDRFLVIVNNNSTETAVRLRLFAIETGLGGADREALLDELVAAAKTTVHGRSIDTHMFIVTGLFNGVGLRLVASNDVAVGAAGAFSANVRIERL